MIIVVSLKEEDSLPYEGPEWKSVVQGDKRGELLPITFSLTYFEYLTMGAHILTILSLLSSSRGLVAGSLEGSSAHSSSCASTSFSI